jgi:acetamidase/formamidase
LVPRPDRVPRVCYPVCRLHLGFGAIIDFLVTEKHLSRDDAYMLASVAADLHITELVDGNKGVYMLLPKSIFVAATK